MAEYIDRQELIENLNKFAPEHYNALVNQLIIKQPTADVVSMKAFEQVKWERDTAIEQLWVHGIALCEKKELVEVVRCKDCKLYTDNMNDKTLRNGFCGRKTAGIFDVKKPTDYCSYGERNENDE